MKRQIAKSHARMVLRSFLVIALSCFSSVWAQPQQQHAPAALPPENQKGFATPQLAAEALIKAAESYDVPAMLEIFGPDGEDLIASEDPVQDKNKIQRFVEKAHQKHSVSVNHNKAILLAGQDNWPMPIPIVKRQGKWYFDTKAGREEILFRRIGANELDAIQICHGYVEAQKEYALTPHGNPPLHQYAQKIISTPGQQDGLFWRNPDGSPGGPIGEEIAGAIQEGYSDKAAPYHGYYFRILKGQGPNAPFGKLDYAWNDVMIGGFALVAVPAEYRVTGVKTFLVSHWGVVYEKDLGPDTPKIAKEITEFNPDKTWRAVKDKVMVAGR